MNGDDEEDAVAPGPDEDPPTEAAAAGQEIESSKTGDEQPKSDEEIVAGEIVEEVRRVARIEALAVVHQEISGPLPSSSEMLGYKNVYPELPKEIVEAAAEERRHRHRMERSQLKIGAWFGAAGVAVGAVWTVGALLVAAYAIKHHESLAGIAAIVAAGVPIVLRLLRRASGADSG